MRIIHTANIHLDHAFTETGVRGAARRRRRALWDALERIADAARDADTLCVAGDLYEHEHVTGETQNALVDLFSRIDVPVLLLPGNHDPYLPGSVYERAPWPDNVHVFTESTPSVVQLTAQVCVWGIAFTARELRPDVLRSFRVPSDGRAHLLMLHASLIGGYAGAESDHCPVTREELAATGAGFVMLVHYHAGCIHGQAAYPGSPEPLTWGETGEHAIDVLTIDDSGAVRPELRAVNRLSFHRDELDVTGASSSAEIERQLREHLGEARDGGLSLRVVLNGDIAPECHVRPDELAARCGDGFAELLVEDSTAPLVDLEQVAREQTVRGRFVADLLAQANAEPERADRCRRAAYAGLRAFAGQREVARVG